MFSNLTIEQAVLPVMPIRGIIPLPNNEIRIEVGRSESIAALKESTSSDKYIALAIQKNHLLDKPTPNDVFDFGVIGKLVYDMESGKIHKIKVLGIVRCKFLEFVQVSPFWTAKIETKPALSEDIEKEMATVRMLFDQIDSGAIKLFEGNNEITKNITKGITADKLTDILAYNLKLDINSKLKYVEEASISKRLEYMIVDLAKERQIVEIEEKIEEEVRKSINESQKEYYLREKMKAIQEELGDKAKKESDIDDLREKILKAKMPKTIEAKALQELSRYASMNSMSPESSVSRTYLDFLISLPWYKESKECHDIKKAKEQLDKDHYGLDIVKDRILEYLAVKIMTNKNPQSILCLVGPPGVGKTSLAKSIALALNKNFVKQSLGGVRDEAEIRGHRRTYVGALPGRILEAMRKAKVINPVFLLDEIDKMASDFRGDPASAMLEVLDPEQNKFFSDHYLEEPYDLSHVFFIATANYLEDIPPTLRDRMEIVEVSSYTEYEKFEIAKLHLIDKQLASHGLKKEDFNLEDDAIWAIIQKYTKEAGVRDLERNIGALVRKAIKEILLGNPKPVTINASNIDKFLGKPKFIYNTIEKEDAIGVVTGLAYTQYGGDTLSIEVTYYKGNGGLMLTGKLGDVMKESAQAALSYVKANVDKFGIDPTLFEGNIIHIHVPEGAVPKDGPSAGVTMATAIISAFSHKAVDHNVGMTGEITLRGRVLPIGGLREKSIAAHRSGLKKILIPKENLRDLDEIPEGVKKELEIIPVDTIDEAVSHALVK